MSVVRIPANAVPDEWKIRLDWRIAAGTVLFFGAGGYLVVEAVVALTQARYLKAGLFALFAVTCVSAIGGSLGFYRRRRVGRSSGVTRTKADPASITFRFARPIWSTFVFLASFAASAGWWGVLRLENKVPWVDSATLARSPVFGIVLLGFAIFAAAAGVEFLRGGFATARITLSETGIRHRSTTVETFFPWAAVEAINASSTAISTGRKSPVTVPTVAITYNPAAGVARRHHGLFGPFGTERPAKLENGLEVWTLRPESFEIGAPRLYSALRFYLGHPKMRAELGADSSIRRIIAGDFTPATL
ncbi:hypothetical protein GPX89_17105 [Nocardia sp. ET3-3]|uniref:Uncharacterized protein n=1 Tax=Nocardia terrae TaxID=2675851 RepID=A0A7K1UYH7_9NOCA|nr:hypothetical protein [Nocardia terrae]MVU78958.1 hypothetical protein [Nocardia terrae]